MLVVTAVCIWLLLLWGSIVALVAGISRLPGAAGLRGRVILSRIAPQMARKLVLTAVGVSMVSGLAACGTGAATAASVEGNAHHGASGASVGPAAEAAGSGPSGAAGQAMGWTSVEGSVVQLRSDLVEVAAVAAAVPARRPNIDWPVAPSTPGQGNSMDIDWPVAPSTPGQGNSMDIDWPTPPGQTRAASATGPVNIDWPAPGAPVVVLRGDTLWSIAARHLPAHASDAEIEKAWRQWSSANSSVIGDNPNLILPGQILQPPNQETGHQS